MAFPKGQKNPNAGRPKGIPNRPSIELRDMVLAAFEELGGTNWLVEVARNDPKTFVPLITKMLPKDVQIDFNNQIEPIQITFIQPSD